MQRAVSPVIGIWQINGSLPPPDANFPRFTQLTFRRDGTLEASYVAAGGVLATVVKSSPQVRQEHDSYTLVGEHHLRIIEGSRALEYRYDVRDGRLFLSGTESGTTMVYNHIDSANEDAETPTPTDTPE